MSIDKYSKYDKQWVHPHEPYKPSPKDEWMKTPPPPKPTLESLFPNFDRWSIGFDPVFSTLKSLAETKTPSYPPYNVSKNGETYFVEVALAGFSKEEVDISVVDQTLTITNASDAKIPTENQIKKSGTDVLYQGIAKRAFKLNFAMSEYVEVQQAMMEDGILTVVCENKVPEALLPKKIEIN